MADVAAGLTGPVRDWLAGQRAALNGRFRAAQRRFPALAADAVLARCREWLPPLAGTDAAAAGELLSAVYELILLHAGRGTLTLGQGVAVLLAETFPAVRPLLLARPQQLPGALSNAVENLGPAGAAFARGITALAPHLQRPEELLDAGAVLAWRLGEARLRGGALDRAARLPAPVALGALGIPDWPAETLPLVLAGLRDDGWHRPGEILSPATRDVLARAERGRIDKLAEELSKRADAAPARWRLAGRLGNFVGFGGHFEQPPLLLEVQEEAGAHRFHVRSGDAVFRIDADVFGWVCTPSAAAAERVAKPQASFDPGGGGAGLRRDRVTSAVVRSGVAALTLADSFRVRVLVPPRKPL